MRKLLIILILFWTGPIVLAFNIEYNEPVVQASSNITYPIIFMNHFNITPTGDERDLFLPQRLIARLEQSSQYLNLSSYTYWIGIDEYCDGNDLLQAFNTFQYSIANPFPQSPASAGFVRINASDVPSPLPQGYNWKCIEYLTAPTAMVSARTPAHLTLLPQGFIPVSPGNLGISLQGGYTNQGVFLPVVVAYYDATTVRVQIVEVPSMNILLNYTGCGYGPCYAPQTPLQPNRVYIYTACNNNSICDSIPIRT